MKEQLQLWLGRNARLPGVLAHATLHPRQGCTSKNWSKLTKTEAVEESLRAMVAVIEKTGPASDGSVSTEMIFENGWVFGARRGDGSWIFLMTSADAPEDELVPVRKLIADFIDLSGTSSET